MSVIGVLPFDSQPTWYLELFPDRRALDHLPDARRNDEVLRGQAYIAALTRNISRRDAELAEKFMRRKTVE